MNLSAAIERDMVLVCDGAMGTMLHAAGNSLDQALPALNLSDPGLVGTIHESYISAGVDIIQTNTFGASRLRLSEHGYGDQVAEINQAGVRIARQAAAQMKVAGEAKAVLVAGSVSPTVTIQQRPQTSRQARTAALREQIEALAEADIILLETFGYLEEFIEAIEIATQVTELPVMAQATFGADGRTLSGHTPREVAAAAASARIATLGINCTLGPQRSLGVLRELRAISDLPLSVQPNAGVPRRVAPARFEYDVNSEYFARYVRQLLEAGATIVGGCCGTTPTQLAAAVATVGGHRRRLASRRVPSARAETAPARTTTRQGAEAAPAATGTGLPSLAELSQAGPGIVVTELTTPVYGSAGETLDLARELTEAGVQLVSIAPARTSRAQLSAMDVAAQLRHSAGIETIAGVTTWDRTIMALQADLLGQHALGLRRIICEAGNPPLLGDYPHVDGVWDVDSIGLIRLLASLNRGADYYSLPLGAKTDFEIGARINPGSRALDREVSHALNKIAAGATFLVTRPVYELTALERLLEAIDGQVPVLASLRPLTSFEEAEYLAHEVPDVIIPRDVLDALERAGDSAPRVGVDLAVRMAARLREMASGIVITPTTDILATTREIMAG
ncbi:bifunctional homocysteine S-methyltransferase/methylenetetrahydrofolate reductase [Streptomyces sp. NPDC007084]|uniref:bifunctional homocysteine S-methyltransferase/methylenetetrahydrofolate reductase n=1 Tax=Streptomyces sp. NPDC007084 TaxID=3154313 RepID=UPI003453DBE4